MWLATPNPPRPRLHDEEFNLVGTAAVDRVSKEVTPERSLDLPIRFGDFELHCEVEVAAGGELDLVFRKVEGWGDVHLPGFHARFSVLRVSNRADGPGFLTREQVLFGPAVGGVRVSAGVPGATLGLECRGHRARALVNGIELGWFDTADDFGNLAFVARGGRAVVRNLKIIPWSGGGVSSLVLLVGAMVGGLVGLVLVLRSATLPTVVLSFVVAVAGGWVARLVVLGHGLPGVQMTSVGILAGALCSMPLAMIVAVHGRRLWLTAVVAVLVGVPGGVALLEVPVRTEAARLAPFEDERLDLYFGPESGTGTFDAVTRMLACQWEKHALRPERYDVLLLGGKQFFDREHPGELQNNVGVALSGLLKSRLKLPRDKHVLCAAFPTRVSHAYQQFLLFESFYQDYRPKVVVFGVTGDEAEPTLPEPARALAAAAAKRRTRSWLHLLDLRRRGDAVIVSSPADLRATLGDVHALCQSIDSRLVLAVDASLPAGYLAELTAFAEAKGLPVVTGFAIDEDIYPVKTLAEAVLTELIK